MVKERFSVTSPKDWLTSRGVARFLHGRRDNDIKVEIRDTLVPIHRLYYSTISDTYVIELVDGEDLSVALGPEQVLVERDWLLAEADDETRDRFFAIRQREREHRDSGGRDE